MPSRIPLPLRFGIYNSRLRQAPPLSNPQLPIVHTASLITMAQRRKYKDPYALAQAKSRKEANLSRRAELQEQRKVALGDPVRGITTPFLESFDDVGNSLTLIDAVPDPTAPLGAEINIPENTVLSHFLNPAEFKRSIKHSIALTEPLKSKLRDVADPVSEAKAEEKFREGHARATIALTRIISLANGSQKDKTRANTMRCIETFGRHRTDQTLRPRPGVNPSILGKNKKTLVVAEKTPRAGPDTGSSEVQIAILTAKIRVLANELEKPRGKNDKVNKRNLRVMVHKRQKLLKYLRKKERGGDRWQHLVTTLGLTDGTWQGEISL